MEAVSLQTVGISINPFNFIPTIESMSTPGHTRFLSPEDKKEDVSLPTPKEVVRSIDDIVIPAFIDVEHSKSGELEKTTTQLYFSSEVKPVTAAIEEFEIPFTAVPAYSSPTSHTTTSSAPYKSPVFFYTITPAQSVTPTYSSTQTSSDVSYSNFVYTTPSNLIIETFVPEYEPITESVNVQDLSFEISKPATLDLPEIEPAIYEIPSVSETYVAPAPEVIPVLPEMSQDPIFEVDTEDREEDEDFSQLETELSFEIPTSENQIEVSIAYPVSPSMSEPKVHIVNIDAPTYEPTPIDFLPQVAEIELPIELSSPVSEPRVVDVTVPVYEHKSVVISEPASVTISSSEASTITLSEAIVDVAVVALPDTVSYTVSETPGFQLEAIDSPEITINFPKIEISPSKITVSDYQPELPKPDLKYEREDMCSVKPLLEQITRDDLCAVVPNSQKVEREDLCAVIPESAWHQENQYRLKLDEDRQSLDSRLVRIYEGEDVKTIKAQENTVLAALDSLLESTGLVGEYTVTEQGIVLSGIKGLNNADYLVQVENQETGESRYIEGSIETETLKDGEVVVVEYRQRIGSQTDVSDSNLDEIIGYRGVVVEGGSEVISFYVAETDIEGDSGVLQWVDEDGTIQTYHVGEQGSQISLVHSKLVEQGFDPKYKVSKFLKHGKEMPEAVYLEDILDQEGNSIAVQDHTTGYMIEMIDENGQRSEAIANDGRTALGAQEAIASPGDNLSLVFVSQGKYDRRLTHREYAEKQVLNAS